MTGTFFSIAIICILLLSGFASICHGQRRVLPVPQFDYAVQNAQAEAYRTALGEMREILCLDEIAKSRSGTWPGHYTQAETDLIVAEHVLVWAAARGATTAESNLIGQFHGVREKMIQLIDRHVRRYPELRAPSMRIRDGGNRFSHAVNNADFPIFTAYAHRAMLYDFDRDVRQTIESTPGAGEYRNLMFAALNILGDFEFQIYDRGIKEIKKRAPRDATFGFMLHEPVGKLIKVRTLPAIAQKFIDHARIEGIDGEALARFDFEFAWHRLSPVTTKLSTDYLTELKGACRPMRVTLIYDRQRTLDAEEMRAEISRYAAPVVMDPRSNLGQSEHRRRIYYQRSGTVAGAGYIADLVKDTEPLTAKSGGVDTDDRLGPDYTIWLYPKAQPKSNQIDLRYIAERTDDAKTAKAILENNGYKVASSVVKESDYADLYPRKLVYRTKRGATSPEAEEITALLRRIEPLELREDNAMSLPQYPTYELYIISKKQVPQRGKVVKIVYSAVHSRLKDAEEAARLLRENGFTVSEVTSNPYEGDVRYFKMLACSPRQGATAKEASEIADIVKHIERAVPDFSPYNLSPPYTLWIVTPK